MDEERDQESGRLAIEPESNTIVPASGLRVKVLNARARADRALAIQLALLGAWLIGYAVLAAARPGELLEWALIGVAGAVVACQRALYVVPVLTLAVIAAFAAPLENVWPVRTFDVAAAHAPLIPGVVGNLPSLLLAVALLLPSARRALRSAPLVLIAPAGFLVIGGLVATVLATNFRSAVQAWLVGLVVPAGWGLLVAGIVRSERQGWLVLGSAVAAAIVPLYIAVAAYLLEFGTPESSNDLLRNKFELVRPHLIQDAVLGNVGHLADLAIVVLPAAALGLSARAVVRPVRLACGTVVCGISLVLVLILERVALVLGLMSLAVLLAIAAGRRTRGALALGVAFLLVFFVAVTQPVRSYVGSAVGFSSPVVQVPGTASSGGAGAGAGAGAAGTPGVETSDASTEMRASAIGEALHLYKEHPAGLGPGQYATYDPVHTAAHSLPVQLLAEDGPLALLGFVMLLGIVVFELVRVSREILRTSTPATYLRLAAGGGALLFLTEATVTGSQLAAGGLNIWGVLLWLQVGVVVALSGKRSQGER
jgi:hypothetical protein